MSTLELREKIYYYIARLEDKKLEAIYTLLENEIETAIYTESFKTELDNRYNDYKSGKATMFTDQESKERIQNLLDEKFSN